MIPNKPLEVKKIDSEELTLGEMELLQGESFSAKTFREFLQKYTNWNEAEIKAITVKELKEVATQLGEGLKETATPLAS